MTPKKKENGFLLLRPNGRPCVFFFFVYGCPYLLLLSYNAVNNGDKVVNKFYVDHSASSAHDGFVIQTEEKYCSTILKQ